MSEQKVMNRWLVALGAMLIQLALGAIYAWSVFTPRLGAAGWTKTQTQVIFAAGLATFAIIMVLAGRMMPKFGPRKLAMAGGVTLGIGYLLGGLIAPTNFYAVLLFVGIIGGAGIGLAYVVPIAVGMRWFPDKKGMISGLAVAGFGFGATLWVKLAGSWGHLLAKTSLGTTWAIYGGAFLVMVLIGGVFMVFPPEGYKPKGWEPPKADDGSKKVVATADFTSSEMLKTPQFWMIWFTFLAGAGAGLMCIGLMKIFPPIALALKGNKGNISAIAGTAMGVFFALFNGLGRIGWGLIADRIGPKLSLVIMTGIQGGMLFLFPIMAGGEYTLYAAALLVGFNFGGNFALFPTITAGTFGTKNIGQNYGWVFLAYGVGGILFPIIGGKFIDMGLKSMNMTTLKLPFYIAGATCIAAAAIIAMMKAPKKA